jgi:hypothetical protein
MTASSGALVASVSASWPALIKMGFGRGSATLVIAIGAERGQNSLVTIASWPLPRMAERGVSMSIMLSLLGIVIAAVGIAAIGFGIPINEFTLGTTLIVSGVSALTGGLILIGLAAVVAELGRLGEAVRARIAVRPEARPAEAAEVEPAPSAMTVPPAPMVAVTVRPPQTVSPRARAETQVSEARPRGPHPAAELPEGDVAAPAAERLRASIPRAERPTAESSILPHEDEVPLSPNGAAHLQTRPPHVEAATPEPKVSPEDRGAVEALKASRLDFLFRSRPTRPASQRENFDAVWSADGRPAKRPESEPSSASEMGQMQADQAAPVQDRRPEPATLAEPQDAAAILKSGVVDGMAYTLYTDGSIEAKLPDGTVRFGSIAELRAHIERNS